MAAITTALRFLLMSVTAEVSLCLFGAGFDQQGWIIVAGYVVVLASIPVAIFTAVMMAIEAMIGRRGGFYISLVGLLPTIFTISLIALYGAARAGWHYAFAVALGGLLWGVMWLLTSKMTPQSPPVAPPEYE